MIVRTYNPIERGAPALWVHGHIGSNVRVQTFARDLRQYPEGDRPIDLFIESDGGLCDVGMEVYGLLCSVRRPKRVTVLAARSMAAVVAMAGDVIRIVSSGHFHLHRPYAVGPSIAAWASENDLTADALRDIATGIDSIEHAHAEIILQRIGQQNRNLLSALVGIGSTIPAERAVELGLADEIVSLPGAAV
ncbi:ATP-dependent protease ClpP protease subunit [Bosea sp. OAE752]|uniref:ATP-dependent Clp protease proteolytic subunit n=1 Tax=Bosea sp. OAE752 TaxID=2663873 RepID=UPI003D211D86